MRIFTLLFVLFSCLFSYDFSYCLKNYQRLALKFHDSYATPIQYQGKTFFLFYSKTPLLDRLIIKSDPFVGLYLLKSEKNVKGYVLRDIDSTAQEMEMALIGFDGFLNVNILSQQKDFTSYAKLSKKSLSNQVVGNICYQIYGITTDEGLIDKRYIQRFLSQNETYYGDIGVRLKNQSTEVEMIDPFFSDNPFLPGDIITAINGEKVMTSDISWKIADLPYQNEATITVLREEHQIDLKVRVSRAYGGLLLQDSFFESQGIKIDKNLNIRRVYHPNIEKLDELKRGDQILMVNKIDPSTLAGDIFRNLRNLLSQSYSKQGYVELLVSRNGFNFTLKIYPKNRFMEERINQNPPEPFKEFRSNQ